MTQPREQLRRAIAAHVAQRRGETMIGDTVHFAPVRHDHWLPPIGETHPHLSGPATDGATNRNVGSESRPKAPDAARIAAVRQLRIGWWLRVATVALALWFVWAEVKR